MNVTKIRLSPEEMELAGDAELILTKNRIIEKVMALFSGVQAQLQSDLRLFDYLPGEIVNSSPKISRGENYKGLPWVVLDYPRYFDREQVFAIRSMFWWGRFFSCTLHLSGQYALKYRSAVARSFETIKKESFYVCINDQQWEHHFEPANYLPSAEMDQAFFDRHMAVTPFIKLATKFPVEEWNEAERKLPGIFTRLLGLLAP